MKSPFRALTGSLFRLYREICAESVQLPPHSLSGFGFRVLDAWHSECGSMIKVITGIVSKSWFQHGYGLKITGGRQILSLILPEQTSCSITSRNRILIIIRRRQCYRGLALRRWGPKGVERLWWFGICLRIPSVVTLLWALHPPNP